MSPLSEAVEDYLKAVYELAREDGTAGTGRIAKHLGVAPASVSGMLRKLIDQKTPLVEYRRHGSVALTSAGRRAALRTLRRHRLIEQFLMEVLGYRWDEVHLEAERLEHAVSALFEERLARLLRQPRFDPHGDPIPDAKLKVPSRRARPLSRLPAGKAAVVCRVRSRSPEVLRYLTEIGLTPGAHVQVIESQRPDATLRLAIGGSDTRVLGHALTDQILVEERAPRGCG